MPLFNVTIETTTVTRQRIVVEADSAMAAVDYANANHEWEDDGGLDTEMDGERETRKALYAKPLTEARDLPRAWIGNACPWNGNGLDTINDILQTNV